MRNYPGKPSRFIIKEVGGLWNVIDTQTGEWPVVNKTNWFEASLAKSILEYTNKKKGGK